MGPEFGFGPGTACGVDGDWRFVDGRAAKLVLVVCHQLYARQLSQKELTYVNFEHLGDCPVVAFDPTNISATMQHDPSEGTSAGNPSQKHIKSHFQLLTLYQTLKS